MSQQSPLFSLWSLPQPIYAFGCTLLAAYTMANPWMEPTLLAAILMFLPFPVFLILERIKPRKKEWLLDWKDLLEDSFWVVGTYAIWLPIYSEYYDTPISRLFFPLRDSIGIDFQLAANTTGGFFLNAMIAIFAIEFIAYWLHRLQHRYMFLWRIHATHHHITKMSVARADRTHPLEFLGLNLSGAVAFALLGASTEVIAVTLVFRMVTAHICHTNLPLQSGAFGWLFNTAEWHQLHHSRDLAESNTNFGCTVIVWDRLFGTFSAKNNIDQLGNGTGRRLSLATQLLLPFQSNDEIRKL
jgi:sterol desaturase/sphingolipid hydroxylase (fatty acid hydroxylase superfamily)